MKTFFKILLAPFLWLLNSCSPLGNPVNEEFSNNHYFNNSKTKIIYSTAGNWFELGKTEMEADIESFKVLNGYVSRDSKNIYFEAYRVENSAIDLSSFNIKNGDYLSNIGFDQNHVYSFEKKFHDKKYRIEAKIIKDANPNTYVRKDWNWAHDGLHHFFRNQKIDADYDSFLVLNDYFAKDKNHTYSRNDTIFEALETDVTTFRILNSSSHGIDSKNVYWLPFFTKNSINLLTIPHTDESEVEFLNRYFLRIANTIYFDGSPRIDIDVQSFEIIDHLYSKDATNVYYEDKVIPNADVLSFKKVDGNYKYQDKNGTYLEGKLESEKSEATK